MRTSLLVACLLTAPWKLIRYPQIDVTQLFDLQTDPEETKNLVAEASHKDRVTDLMGRLAKLQKQYDDDLPLTVANPMAATPVTPEQFRLLAKPASKK